MIDARERELDQARADYADMLDHLAKFARTQCTDIREGGGAIDVMMANLLTDTRRRFDRVIKAGG